LEMQESAARLPPVAMASHRASGEHVPCDARRLAAM
jgi:hypothetical protein